MPNRCHTISCHAIFVLTASSDQELHACKMHYNHTFKNHLRDVILERNRGTTLSLDSQGVEYFKITKDIFAEALNNSPKIVESYQKQMERAFERGGFKPGMEAL